MVQQTILLRSNMNFFTMPLNFAPVFFHICQPSRSVQKEGSSIEMKTSWERQQQDSFLNAPKKAMMKVVIFI